MSNLKQAYQITQGTSGQGWSFGFSTEAPLGLCLLLTPAKSSLAFLTAQGSEQGFGLGLIHLGVWDTGEMRTSPEVISNGSGLRFDHPQGHRRSKKNTFPVCYPLSQISLKSLLHSTLFPFWHRLHKCPLFSASSLPPNVSLAPTLSAGMPQAAGLLVTNHQAGSGIPGPSQDLLIDLALPSPTCPEPGYATDQGRQKQQLTGAHPPCQCGQRRTWWLEAAVQNLCPRTPAGMRGGFGDYFISLCSHCPSSSSDHLPQETLTHQDP